VVDPSHPWWIEAISLGTASGSRTPAGVRRGLAGECMVSWVIMRSNNSKNPSVRFNLLLFICLPVLWIGCDESSPREDRPEQSSAEGHGAGAAGGGIAGKAGGAGNAGSPNNAGGKQNAGAAGALDSGGAGGTGVGGAPTTPECGPPPLTGACVIHTGYDSCGESADCLLVQCLPGFVLGCQNGSWLVSKDCQGERCVPFEESGFCGGKSKRSCPEGQACKIGPPASGDMLGQCVPQGP
jgi:hypothetical protein